MTTTESLGDLKKEKNYYFVLTACGIFHIIIIILYARRCKNPSQLEKIRCFIILASSYIDVTRKRIVIGARDTERTV